MILERMLRRHSERRRRRTGHPYNAISTVGFVAVARSCPVAGTVGPAWSIVVIEDTLPAYWLRNVAGLFCNHSNDIFILWWDFDVRFLLVTSCKRFLMPAPFLSDILREFAVSDVDLALVISDGIVYVNVPSGLMLSINLP